MKLNSKEIVLFSILGSILFISQISLSFLPNIEIVSLLVILYTLVYGKKSMFSIGIFILEEGIFYGFGTWWMGYVLIWPTLVLLTLILKRWINGKFLALSIFSAVFGLLFGVLYAMPYAIMGDFSFAFTYWLRGIPFDLVHMLGNYFVMIILGETVYNIIVKMNKAYFGLSEV